MSYSQMVDLLRKENKNEIVFVSLSSIVCKFFHYLDLVVLLHY